MSYFYRNLLILTLLATCVLACNNPRLVSNNGQVMAQEEHMQADVAFLADDALEGRMTTEVGGHKAAQYIAERMRLVGLKPAGENNTYFQGFYLKKQILNPHSTNNAAGAAYNVLGMIDNPGSNVIVVGAHYDHLGHGTFGSLDEQEGLIHNGADDNASGVAVILELARQFKAQPINDDILFIAFTGEELGLLGSSYFMENKMRAADQIKCMLNYDMVGRFQADKGLAVNGVGTATEWDGLLVSANMNQISLITSESGAGPSDHANFYYEGIPSLHFFTGQHEDYHKSTDDIEKINYMGMKNVVDLSANLIRKISAIPSMSFQQTVDPAQQSRSFNVTLGVMPDYLFDGMGMRLDGVKPERPAYKAGMVKGDIVIMMDTQDIKDMNDYMSALESFEKGSTVRVVFLRDGVRHSANVTFE